jgi:hypothetical protein
MTRWKGGGFLYSGFILSGGGRKRNQELLIVSFVVSVRGKQKHFFCHPRESGDPEERELEARKLFRTRRNQNREVRIWVPAFAGMTERGETRNNPIKPAHHGLSGQ